MELKEKKVLEIGILGFKNRFRQFYKLRSFKVMYNSFLTTFMNTTFLCCKSYILPSLKYFSSADYDILASYIFLR